LPTEKDKTYVFQKRTFRAVCTSPSIYYIIIMITTTASQIAISLFSDDARNKQFKKVPAYS